MLGRASAFRYCGSIVLAMFMLASLLTAQKVAAAESQDAVRPVAQLLNPNGTLNLSGVYSGPLDSSAYQVSLDAARGRVLSPLMTVNT